MEGSTLITVPPKSRNATFGETVPFTCISQYGDSLFKFELHADPSIENMTKSHDVIINNGNRQKTLNITVPPGTLDNEINITCTAFRNLKHQDSKKAKLIIQGERNENLLAR